MSVGEACAGICCRAGCACLCTFIPPSVTASLVSITCFVLGILSVTPVLNIGVGAMVCFFILSLTFGGLACAACCKST
jgi:hypothetical protein